MNQLKNVWNKKALSDELFLHFSSTVENLTVFSIIYMVRIRCFGPVELIQNGFSAAQYIPPENSKQKVFRVPSWLFFSKAKVECFCQVDGTGTVVVQGLCATRTQNSRRGLPGLWHAQVGCVCFQWFFTWPRRVVMCV